MSVPDLKEAAGGLRDANVLKALVASWLVDVSHVELERCRRNLLDVRDVLQGAAGRATDRVAPELWGELAVGLELEDEYAAQVHVRELGRRIAHLSRLTWRRVDAVLAKPASVTGARRPAITNLSPGIALVRRRGGAGVDGAAGPGPADAAARGRDRCRAGRRARAGDRGAAGPRVPAADRPVARGCASAAGAAAGVGPRPARRLGDARGDRGDRRDPSRVGPDPAAAARVADPPVHRRPARRRDLHRGVRVDPARRAPRRTHGGGAAPRHRQGRADRAQHRRRTAGPRDRDPDGLRRGGGRPDRHPGPLAPAARRDRDHPRPRRPGDGGVRRQPDRWRRGDVAAVRAHRGRCPGHVREGLVDLALRADPRPRTTGLRGARPGHLGTRSGDRGDRDPGGGSATVGCR